MRWKLLLLVTFVAAILALGLWSAIAIAVFGSARVMAQNDWLLLASLVIPLSVTAYAGMFVYRHTSRRRKTQALITAVLALFFTGAIYLIASQIFPRLIIPRTYEVRIAR
jgi:cytochrome bd-type quinol oxidase subunit 2